MSIFRWLQAFKQAPKKKSRVVTKHAFLTERLEDRTMLAVFTWDGRTNSGGFTGNSNWTTASNWVGDIAPSANDDLIFPAGAAQLTSVNNFPSGTDFSSIQISGSNYNISGNSVDLSGGISAIGSGSTMALNIKLLVSQGFSNSSSGTLTVTGQIDLNGNDLNLTTASSSGTTEFAGSISGVGNLLTNGGGKAVLAAFNSYTGTTTIADGTLSVRHARGLGTGDGLLGTGTIVTNSSANIQLENGVAVTNELLTSAAATSIHFSSIGTSVWAGSIVSGGSVYLEPVTGSTLQINGNITADGSGFSTLRVNGSGKVILNGSANGNNMNSFDVLSGIAEVNGTITTLNGNYDTNSGTISGTGLVAWGSVDSKQIFGTINPGTLSGTGVLDYGSVSFQSGSNFNVLLNGINAGSGHDQLGVTGTVSLGGNLNVSIGSTPIASGAFYRILDNDGADAITGTFTGLAENASVIVGSQTFRISYMGGDGNDVVLEALTGSVAVNGTISNDNLSLRRNGNVIELRNGTALIYSSPLASIQASGLLINGDAGDDTLTIDYGVGGFFALPVIFNGDTPTSSSPGDQLIVTGGTFNSVTSNSVSANEGSVVFNTGSETSTVSHLGLESIDLTGTIGGRLVLNLPAAGATAATLTDDGTIGNSYSLLLGSALVRTLFVNPSDSLEIRPGSATDKLVVKAIPDFTSSLSVGSNSGRFGTVEFAGSVSLAVNRSLSAHAQTIWSTAPLTTSGGEVELHATGDITVTKPIISGGGVQNLTADSDGDGNGTLALRFIGGDLVDPSRTNGNQFGAFFLGLSSGNIVVTAPFDDAGGTDAGAVYLFDGSSGALISTIRGNAPNNRIGSGGVRALSNGNFLILSPLWDNGTSMDVGAVTLGSGLTGVSGVVSSTNSLVGSRSNDQVGTDIAVLPNGNYVVLSPGWDNGAVDDVGAVSWGNGNTGVVGSVSQFNSLIGSTAGDQVGSGGARLLSNGNYIVGSPNWDAASVNVGAVTWGSGSSGVAGTVSSSNSLVGSSANDQVGLEMNSARVLSLSNGNYVVVSPNWDNAMTIDAAAVTWGNGTTGTTGVVNASNSLVGGATGDLIVGGGVTALTNGNFVINSPNWDDGIVTNVGAVTWVNGTVGLSGLVSSGNSLIGSVANDQLGSGGITALNNGNYVVNSPLWDNGFSINAGAVTWGSGASGTVGTVTQANSMVGNLSNDSVGSGGITALSNGNYVVKSPLWDNAAAVDAGAVTWGNGGAGATGFVSIVNSLVGSFSNDQIGSGAVNVLTNHNFVVNSPTWNANRGASTWGSGTTGLVGNVSASNSFVGSAANHQVGIGGARPLTNGNYVVRSPRWDNGAITDAGAATWGNGDVGSFGVVGVSNSLVGAFGNNQIGSNGIWPLRNGNYVVTSPLWDNGGDPDVGAATWGSGSGGISGVVDTGNSLVGDYFASSVGSGGVVALANGNYTVLSPLWSSGGVLRMGAVTWGNGSTGLAGIVSSSNSLVGSNRDDYVGWIVSPFSNGNYVVSSSSWASNRGAVTWGNGNNGVAGVVGEANSFIGNFTGSSLSISPPGDLSDSQIFVARFATSFGNRISVLSPEFGIVPAAPLLDAENGDIYLNGPTMSVLANVSSNATVSLATSAANRPIRLGGLTTGSLSLSDAVLDRIGAATIEIGNSSSGLITISSAISRPVSTNLILQSPAGIVIDSGANLNSAGGAIVSASSNLLVSGSVTGPMFIPSGSLLKGTGTTGSITVQNGGGVAPGASPGILNSGSIDFNSGSDFDVELNGTTVGTQYDQLNVTGSVTLNDGNLNLSLGFVPVQGSTFTIINNDLGDTVLGAGTFKVNGSTIPQGGSFIVGQTRFVIDYTAGSNNNDVVLTVQNYVLNVSLSSGNLVITEIIGNTNDTLTISRNGGNIRVTDQTNAIRAGQGGVQVLGNAVEFPLANITGSITVHGGGGTDDLTLDFSGGNPISNGGLVFHGGQSSSLPGDSFQIQGGNQGTVTYNHTNGNDGEIVISNYGSISYTGIESTANRGSAGRMIVNLPSVAGSGMLDDDGFAGNGLSLLTAGSNTVPTVFSNSLSVLEIRSGAMNSRFVIGAIPDLDLSLVLGSSSSRFQTVEINGAVSLTGSRFLNAFAQTILTRAPLTTSGGGIGLFATADINVTKPILSAGGVQTLTADSDGDGNGTLNLQFFNSQLLDPNPAVGNQFGATALILNSGNVVVTSPFDDAGGTDAGAVYLFDGITGGLISTLRGGSANDRIGSGGITLLANGNFVVKSPLWDNGAISDAGAATWGSPTTGIAGVVSVSNSLVGSNSSDQIGVAITPLSNGNYIVSSPTWNNGAVPDVGAVTWGNGITGISGVVATSNSLVGSSSGDQVGLVVTALTNGNYVVGSSLWNNGSTADVGASTWANGMLGLVGVVNASNSLIGSSANDRIGAVIRALANGNFITSSTSWDNGSTTDVGAVTWGSGASGIVGSVSGSNSLVGSSLNDRIGNGGVTLLPNGNYVVSSPNWTSSSGAVTWGNGSAGVTGSVSSSNSLVGNTGISNVGSGGIVLLSNGNFVVSSPLWDSSSLPDLGAVTFVNGATGLVGGVSGSNSLVGSTFDDRVGSGGIVPLSNGNFIVNSPRWNGTATDVGAVTWVNGTTGRVGTVSVINSLVGGSANETFGTYSIRELANGNYVMVSPLWNNGAIVDAGAAIWASGATGITGVVGNSNSLVGNIANSQVGSNGVVALSNGNYVVSSNAWNGSRGAATWGNGSTGTVGTISVSNSLVGNTSIQVGSGGIYALANGNYVVSSPIWDSSRGAVTWGNGQTGTVGLVSGSNSLVGSTANDSIGSNGGITALSNGNYVVTSLDWDNGTMINTGAVTWLNGSSPTVAVVNVNNSLVGNFANNRIGSGGVTALVNGNYLVKSPLWDSLTATDVGAISWGSAIDGVVGTLSGDNSIFGTTTNFGSTIQVELNSSSDRFVIRLPNENNGRLVVGRQSSGLSSANGMLASGHGDIILNAANLNQQSNVVSSSAVFIWSQQNNRPINLGTSVVGSLSLTDNELDRISAGTIQFGNPGSGPITISAAISRATPTNLIFESPGGITVNNGIDLNSAGGTISPQASVMTVLGSVTGPIAIPNGSLLKGTGTTSSLAVNGGGTVAPGSSPGRLNAGDVLFANGSNFNVELNGTDAGDLYDQLVVAGSVTLNGSNLNINLGFMPVSGDTFTIINNDGIDAVVGAGFFKVDGVSISDGGAFFVGGTRFLIDYSAGSDNNDVVLTAASISVQEAYVFYKGSGFQSALGTSGAIDPVNDGANPDGKDLLRSSSSPQTTSLTNVSNYSKGINGLVFDVDHLVASQLSASDFIFRRPERLLPAGLVNPSRWSGMVPAPTSIQVSALSGTRSRVVVEWADNAIENTWLQVVLRANANTGLRSPVVHYLGHARGEVTGMSASVTDVDLIAVQGAMGAGIVPVSNLFDINKDQYVDMLDVALIEKVMSKSVLLNNITIPVAGSIEEGGRSDYVLHSSGTASGGDKSGRNSVSEHHGSIVHAEVSAQTTYFGNPGHEKPFRRLNIEAIAATFSRPEPNLTDPFETLDQVFYDFEVQEFELILPDSKNRESDGMPKPIENSYLSDRLSIPIGFDQ